VPQQIHESQQGVFTSGALSSLQKRQISPGIGFASIRSYVIATSRSCIAVPSQDPPASQSCRFPAA